jgi:hypothetical protein
MNRDYFCAEGCTKIHQIWDRPVTEVRLKYRQVKGARISEQTFPLEDMQVRGPKARGIQVTKRTVTSATAIR